MKKYDVIALGELLIDFTMNGVSEQHNSLFEANPGGAPCNVLAMLTKMNKSTAFIGKVGNDMFGKQLEDTLVKIGINTENLVKSKEVRTTLAFVHTASDGDRSFSFYRNPGADMMLRKEDIKKELFEDARIFHFGTLSMTDELVKDATKRAITYAKDRNMLISFDPNLRPPLWKNIEEAKVAMDYGMRMCSVLKISDDEIEFFTGEQDFEKGIKFLQDSYHIPLICLTLGKQGSIAYTYNSRVKKAGFSQGVVIDTTGAGDTFMGCILNYILDKETIDLEEEQLLEMLTFANAAASMITTKRGALRVMPEKEEVESFLNRYNSFTGKIS
ncbi:MAG: carbohydrate kinase [Lachnospiraceae bacterium]|nr:carbohydrate kinase [Lachnospiraceae bacterium]